MVIERRRTFLAELSLSPLDERILELAEDLVRPGAIPQKSCPGRDSHRRRQHHAVLVLVDVEPSAHRQCAHPPAGRKDSHPAWLLASHYLHPRPTHRMSAGGKTKFYATCTRGATPIPPHTATTSRGSSLTSSAVDWPSARPILTKTVASRPEAPSTRTGKVGKERPTVASARQPNRS